MDAARSTATDIDRAVVAMTKRTLSPRELIFMSRIPPRSKFCRQADDSVPACSLPIDRPTGQRTLQRACLHFSHVASHVAPLVGLRLRLRMMGRNALCSRKSVRA